MQKKLIALAIAGLSSAAFAQSNVTVYGVVDGTFESSKADGATVGTSNTISRARAVSNSSYVGFKGSEALGNGLTAVFQIENQIDLMNGSGQNQAVGTSGWNTRDTFVGLAGSFGTVAMGQLTHPIRAMGAAVSFDPGASSAGFNGSIYGEFAGIKTGSDDRAKSAIAYISPNFNGFSVVAAYVAQNQATDGSNVANNPSVNKRQYQLAATYDNGPLYVGLGHHIAKDPSVLGAIQGTLLGTAAGAQAVAGTYNDELKVTRLVAKYAFATGTTVSALWDSQKYTSNGIAGANTTDAKRNAWMLGVKQNFGANNVWLEYAKAKSLTGAVTSATNAAGDSLSGDTGAKQWTLGYSYDLSKRTQVHALYTQLTNDRNVNHDFYVNPVAAQGTYANRGADSKVYGVGLRHSF